MNHETAVEKAITQIDVAEHVGRIAGRLDRLEAEQSKLLIGLAETAQHPAPLVEMIASKAQRLVVVQAQIEVLREALYDALRSHKALKAYATAKAG